MIALITPTGARRDQFMLCHNWMKRQTYDGEVVWIIVDDAYPITTECVTGDFRERWDIVKIYPTPTWRGENSQGRNIKAGIDSLLTYKKFNEVKAVFIIEDDDYYKAVYLEEMVKRLGNYNVIGETNTIYYNVEWRQHCDNNNKQHSSLFQTAFVPSAIPLFLACLNNKFIDADYWIKEQNKYLFHAGTLSVGMKGMPGRGGIGAGHKRTMFFLQDPSMNYLKQLIGEEDAKQYARYYRNNHIAQHSRFVRKSL